MRYNRSISELLTTAVQTLVPYTSKRILLAPVAVDVGVGDLRGTWGDDRLFNLLARLLVRLFHARCLDREENVGDIVLLACLRAGHAAVTKIEVCPKSTHCIRFVQA